MIIKFNKNMQLKNQPTLLLSHAPKLFIAFLILFPLCYFFIDKPIAYFFENLSYDNKAFFTLITNLIDPFYYYLLAPAAYFFARFLFHKQTLSNRILLIALAVPLANIVINLLKIIFGRDRPELLLHHGLYGLHLFEGYTNAEGSFPSGHACTVGVLMSSLACFYPRRSWYLLLIAFCFAFSRVALDKHYLSDILGGLLIGLVVAQGSYVIMKKEKIAF